jgi:hypothetical protein
MCIYENNTFLVSLNDNCVLRMNNTVVCSVQLHVAISEIIVINSSRLRYNGYMHVTFRTMRGQQLLYACVY